MKIIFLAVMFLVNIIFYMVEISFKSFSKISLAGLLEDFEQEKKKGYDYVEHYETVLNSLSGFSFFLQLCLFIYSFIMLEKLIPNPLPRAVLLIFSFLFVFNFLLYTISAVKKEAILGKLIFLIPIARIVFYPFNIVFSFFTRQDLEEIENEPDDLSEKELETFFEESTKDGVLEKEDKEMIVSVLEFGDTLVKEIMTPRVDMIYVNHNVSLEKLVKTIDEKKKSRYPVTKGRIDNIEGIILAKDVFSYLDKKDFKIEKILREPFFIPETMRIYELLKELQKSKQKFAVVVDEFGGISGVVTMEDIIEEIVGEIHDEYDEDSEQIVREKDGLIVKGDTDIFELTDTLKINLDQDEDFQTVAGLLSYKMGRIPQKTDEITIHGHIFKVIDMEKNRIKKVKIYPALSSKKGSPKGTTNG